MSKKVSKKSKPKQIIENQEVVEEEVVEQEEEQRPIERVVVTHVVSWNLVVILAIVLAMIGYTSFLLRYSGSNGGCYHEERSSYRVDKTLARWVEDNAPNVSSEELKEVGQAFLNATKKIESDEDVDEVQEVVAVVRQELTGVAGWKWRSFLTDLGKELKGLKDKNKAINAFKTIGNTLVGLSGKVDADGGSGFPFALSSPEPPASAEQPEEEQKQEEKTEEAVSDQKVEPPEKPEEAPKEDQKTKQQSNCYRYY